MICTQCGATFTATRAAEYCSSACRQRAYRIRNAASVTDTETGSKIRNATSVTDTGTIRNDDTVTDTAVTDPVTAPPVTGEAEIQRRIADAITADRAARLNAAMLNDNIEKLVQERVTARLDAEISKRVRTEALAMVERGEAFDLAVKKAVEARVRKVRDELRREHERAIHTGRVFRMPAATHKAIRIALHPDKHGGCTADMNRAFALFNDANIPTS